MSLEFLKNISLASNVSLGLTSTKAPKAPSTTKNPTHAHLRVFKNGKVYPSEDLVKIYNLEYPLKSEQEKSSAQGFDFFSSKSFPNTAHNEQKVLFIAAVAKNLPKVDLFGSTIYDEDGKPKSSVLTQGTSTAGLAIIDLLASCYGFEFVEEETYVDLVIVPFYFKTEDDTYHIPKTKSRGEGKNEVYMLPRKGLNIKLLVPVQQLTEEELEQILEETRDAVPVTNQADMPENTENKEQAEDETPFPTFDLPEDFEVKAEETEVTSTTDPVEAPVVSQDFGDSLDEVEADPEEEETEIPPISGSLEDLLTA